jgi:hypothetical protein
MAILDIVLYCVLKKPSAPSRIASDISTISGGPSSFAKTHLVRYIDKRKLMMHTVKTNTMMGEVLAPM